MKSGFERSFTGKILPGINRQMFNLTATVRDCYMLGLFFLTTEPRSLGSKDEVFLDMT